MLDTVLDALNQLEVVEEVAEPQAVTSLDLLRAVYRDPSQPLSVRMRAAAMCLPFEFPKLSVTGTASLATGFAGRLEALAQQRGIATVIVATPFRKGVASPAPVVLEPSVR